MKQLLIIVVLVALGAAAWFFVGPLFVDRTVDEPFALVDEYGHFNKAGVMEMAPEEQQKMMNEIMDAAAASMETVVDEVMPSGPVVLATGSFRDADPVHAGRGTATLYQLPSGEHIVRFEDFETTNGPDLVVYLVQHPDPASADDVQNSYSINLGQLKGNVGNQNYAIPADVDVAEFGSVVIWCELFGVLFSPAALTRTEA